MLLSAWTRCSVAKICEDGATSEMPFVQLSLCKVPLRFANLPCKAGAQTNLEFRPEPFLSFLSNDVK